MACRSLPSVISLRLSTGRVEAIKAQLEVILPRVESDVLKGALVSYERLKRGDIAELTNLHGLSHALVALRIALGMTQRELASRLGVRESQVSRDET